MKRTTTIETIKATVKENNFKVYAINDHNGRKMELTGVCILNNGKFGALIKTNKPYSINELYIEDGELNISEWSISGVVIPEENDLFSKEGIDSFNETITFDSRKIDYVISIKDIRDSITNDTIDKVYNMVVKNMKQKDFNKLNFKNALSFYEKFKMGFETGYEKGYDFASRKLDNYNFNHEKFINRTNMLYTVLGLWIVYSISKRGLKGHLRFAYSNPGKKFLLGALLESIIILSSIEKKGDK